MIQQLHILILGVLICCGLVACSLFSGDEEEIELPLDPGTFVAKLYNEKGFEDHLTGYSGWKTFNIGYGPQTYIILSPGKDASFWENAISIIYQGKPNEGTFSVSTGTNEDLQAELDVVYYRDREGTGAYSGIFSIDSGELIIVGSEKGHLKGNFQLVLKKGGWALDNLAMSVSGRFHAVHDTSLSSDLVQY